MRRAVGTVFAIAAFAAAATAAHAARSDERPQGTVIGDSVLTAVLWNPVPLATMTRGFDLRVDVGVCRRLTGVSCPYEGGNVPTLLDVVHKYGPDLGDTVLVEVGYNDPTPTFADEVEHSIQALLQSGVKHILWSNLHGWTQQIVDMNAVLAAAAQRHPELTVIDWNGYASDHWSWFQGDNIHLSYDGAMAIAPLFNTALAQVIGPALVVDTTSLPRARVGRPFATRLVAHGGLKPYAWRIVKGQLPRGLTLRPDGRILGRPRRSGQIRLVVRATDAQGRIATTREALRIVSQT